MIIEFEHIYIGTDKLPKTLHSTFPDGCCTVFANEELIAAYPATNEQTEELGNLAEIYGIAPSADDVAMNEYLKLRDRLCAPHHYVQLTALIKKEMEKEYSRDTRLASAARNN